MGMENEMNKKNFGVMEESVMENEERSKESLNIVNFSYYEFFVRFLAMILTLIAAIILGINKQTKTVPLQLTPILPPLHIPVTAKWHYLSAFVYFMVTNAIASSYAAFSLILLAVSKGRSKSLRSMMNIMDILMVALLFSGFGAAAGVGVIGFKGNSHVRWNKICNVFGRFCNQGVASLILSLVGAILFLLLAILTAFKLERKSK